MKQKVSIVMCCYNSEKYLHYSIGSVLRQTYTNWELICVDDESQDNTYSILQEYARHDNRIKVFKKERGGAVAPSFNYALKHVTGDFIGGIGHDDEISENCLESCMGRYKETGADVIILNLLFFYPDDESKNYWVFPEDRELILNGKEAFILSINWKIHGFGFYRSEIMKKYGFFEEGMNGDEYSCREFFINSNKIAFVNEENAGYYKYYQLQSSLTKKLTPKLFDIHKTFMKLEQLARDHDISSCYIKKINEERYSQFYNLYKKYLDNKNSFSEVDRVIIEGHLDENLSLLKPYKRFIDYFFMPRLCDKKGKFTLLFSYIKVYYKRFSCA